MTVRSKSKNELLDELGAMRERVDELEESEGQRRWMEYKNRKVARQRS